MVIIPTIIFLHLLIYVYCNRVNEKVVLLIVFESQGSQTSQQLDSQISDCSFHSSYVQFSNNSKVQTCFFDGCILYSPPNNTQISNCSFTDCFFTDLFGTITDCSFTNCGSITFLSPVYPPYNISSTVSSSYFSGGDSTTNIIISISCSSTSFQACEFTYIHIYNLIYVVLI